MIIIKILECLLKKLKKILILIKYLIKKILKIRFEIFNNKEKYEK